MSENTKSEHVGGGRSGAAGLGRVLAEAGAEAEAIIARALAEAITARALFAAAQLHHAAARPGAAADLELGEGDPAARLFTRVHEQADAIERQLGDLRDQCEALSVELGRLRVEALTNVAPAIAQPAVDAADVGVAGDLAKAGDLATAGGVGLAGDVGSAGEVGLAVVLGTAIDSRAPEERGTAGDLAAPAGLGPPADLATAGDLAAPADLGASIDLGPVDLGPVDLGPVAPGVEARAQDPAPAPPASGATEFANGGGPRASEAGSGTAHAAAVPAEVDLARTARLIALPMAVAGNSRADVERHLRESLGLEDPTAVLDHVFGASSPPA